MNSWMPLQQITYHILRVYLKTQRLTESADNFEPAIMSNYHIKTLMLWACELKPRSWWTENLNLVRICVELLHTLSVWLTDTRCPHYFINSCNLLDNSLSDGAVASKLMSIDETYLSRWLVNNYVRQCAQLCSDHILRLFDDISTSAKLQKAVSEIVRWRLNTSLYDMWRAVDFAEYFILGKVSVYSLPIRSRIYWMNGLAEIDERLSVYFSAVELLHVARYLSRNSFSDDVMNILPKKPGRRPNFNEYCSVLSLPRTDLSTPELVGFLQKSAVEHLTTYRQSVARDFGSVATIVATDYEALYAYKRGDYQRCLQLSTQNVHTLLFAVRMPNVQTFPEFIQLFDDDIVSLTSLMLMVNSKCRDDSFSASISQLTLSLYLMTQCQLKLRHLVTPLVRTYTRYCINVAQGIHLHDETLNQLTLKLIERNVHRAS